MTKNGSHHGNRAHHQHHHSDSHLHMVRDSGAKAMKRILEEAEHVSHASKHHRSNSETCTKTKTDKMNGSDVHGSTDGRYVYVVLHKPIKYKGLGRIEYWRDNQYNLTTPSGLQKVTTIAVINSVKQWTTDQSFPQQPDTVKNNLFSLNPGQSVVGSNYFPSTVQPANDRLVCSSAVWQAMFYNNSNTACRIDLYYYVAKKSTSTSGYPETLLDSGAVTDGLGKSLISVPLTANPIVATSSGYINNTVWPIKPTDVPLVKQFWKLLKVSSMHLAADTSEEVKLHVKVNKLMKKEAISQLNMIPGTTVAIVARIYGQAIHDKTGAGTNCTIAPVNVNVVDSIKWKLCSVKDGSSTRLNTEQMDYNNIPTGATLVNLQEVINTDVVSQMVTG